MRVFFYSGAALSTVFLLLKSPPFPNKTLYKCSKTLLYLMPTGPRNLVELYQISNKKRAVKQTKSNERLLINRHRDRLLPFLLKTRLTKHAVQGANMFEHTFGLMVLVIWNSPPTPSLRVSAAVYRFYVCITCHHRITRTPKFEV